MKQLFNSLSFKRQIVLGFLGVILIPIIAFSLLVTQIYTMTFYHEMEQAGNQQIEILQTKMSDFFASAEQTCAYLCEGDISALALINKGENDYQHKLYERLYQERTSIPMDVLVSIYDVGGKLRFTTKTNYAEESLPLYWGILEQARRERDEKFQVSDSIISPDSEVVLRTCYTVNNNIGAKIGYIVMELQKSDFDVLFRGEFNTTDIIYVMDENMNILYCSNDSKGKYVVSDILNQELRDKSTWYAMAKDEATGYSILLQKTSQVSREMTLTMFRIGIVLSVVSLGFCILLALFLGEKFCEPITQLNRAMNVVKKGDFSVRVDTPLKNEVGELTQNFNHMTQELDTHVKNMVQRQKDIKDMQIQLFQTQLNPHFLYNTLDSIKWTARIHQLDDISSMAENLAYILRFSIRSEQFIPLKKELEMLESYIEIQRIRFEDRFQYEVEIPDNLVDCIVPKLMLQPIVENAIIHGLSQTTDGLISIYADEVGDEIHIFVTDNGIGVSDEIIEWLEKDDFMKKEGHMGLFNVNKIIKLYFGQQYGIHATVEEDIGTTFTICLPIKKDVKLHD